MQLYGMYNTINVVCNHPEAMYMNCSQLTYTCMNSEVLELVHQEYRAGILLI